MKKNYFLKLSFLLFIIIFLINSCKVLDEDILQEVTREKTINTISFEQFKQRVTKNDQYEKLTHSVDFNRSAAKDSKKSGNIIISENIISIEKDNFTSYTFGIENNADDNTLYNLVVYVNKNNEIFKSFVLGYKPSQEWLHGKAEFFSGTVNLLGDNTNLEIVQKSKSTYRMLDDCVKSVMITWECSNGVSGHQHGSPGSPTCTADSFDYVITVNYGTCSGTGSGTADTFDPNSGNTGSSGSGGGNSEIITAPNTIPYTTNFKNFESGLLNATERNYLNSESNIRNYTDRYLIENNFSGPSQFISKNALEFGCRFQLNFEQYRWVLNNKTILFEEFQNFLFSNPDFNLTKAVINQFLQNSDIKWKEFEATLNFANKFLEDNPDTLDKEDIINRIKALDNLLIQNPDALLDIPCKQLPFWKEVAEHKIPQSVRTKLQNIKNQTSLWSNWEITSIDDASGPTLNMDLFPVKITEMPEKSQGVKYTPAEFFDYFRKNINLFAEKFTPIEDNYYNIHDTSLWNSANPLGALIHITIPVDNGTVVCSGVSTNTWIFSTIKAPLSWKYDGIHPVAGNRVFSYNMSGNIMTIYTRGVDRMSTINNQKTPFINYLMEVVTFGGADDLWTGMQKKLTAEIIKKGGKANVEEPQKYRRRYVEVIDFLKNKSPITILGCK